MTYEELLAKVASFSCCSGAHELALRAVIELHAPFPSGMCGCGIDDKLNDYRYPCQTVQALEAVISDGN
jgi:hypothetical protein